MSRTPTTGMQSNSLTATATSATASTANSRHSLSYRPGASILPPRPSSRLSVDIHRAGQSQQLRHPTPLTPFDPRPHQPPTSATRLRGGSLQHLLPPSKSMSGLSITASSPSPCRSASVGSLQRTPHQSRLSALCSFRLRSMRTVTRMAVINILPDESVCLEFFDPQVDQQKLVVEVMGISADGQEVIIYHPNGGRGVPPNSNSPVAARSGDTYGVYRLAQLPEKYWKKYQFVSK